MNFMVRMGLKAKGLDPADPAVALTLRVSKLLHPDVHAALIQSRDAAWLLDAARKAASPETKAALLKKGLTLFDWAEGAAALAKKDPSAAAQLHKMRHLF